MIAASIFFLHETSSSLCFIAFASDAWNHRKSAEVTQGFCT